MTPEFSIILPVYNVAPWLRRCLDSIVAQRFTDWECVCVDDGSTDESGVILDEYAAKDARFRVIHQKNQGVAGARQVALEHILGDWMVAIDPDDWVEPSHLKSLHDAIENGAPDMVWCNYYYDEGERSTFVSTNGEARSEEHLKALLMGRLEGSLCNHTMSREFITRHAVRFPPKGCDITEDLYFLSLVLIHHPKIQWVDVANYHYVHRNSSLVGVGLDERHATAFVQTTASLTEALRGHVDSALLNYRHELVKYLIYDQPRVSNQFFRQTFPEVRRLESYPVACWHRLFFRLSVLGFRSMVLWMLACIRFVRHQ